MKTFKDLKVGDVVYYRASDIRHNTSGDTTITKVGRKYVYIKLSNGFECKINEWSNDGYAIALVSDYPHGAIYESKEVYDEMNDFYELQELLSRSVRNNTLPKQIKNKFVELAKELGVI